MTGSVASCDFFLCVGFLNGTRNGNEIRSKKIRWSTLAHRPPATVSVPFQADLDVTTTISTSLGPFAANCVRSCCSIATARGIGRSAENVWLRLRRHDLRLLLWLIL